MQRKDLFYKIMAEIKDTPYKNVNQLAKKMNMRWETVKHITDIFQKLGLVKKHKETNLYHWAVVPFSFYAGYKKETDEYISVLEKRLLRLKYKKDEEFINSKVIKEIKELLLDIDEKLY